VDKAGRKRHQNFQKVQQQFPHAILRKDNNEEE
jgi:hypothetical protein